MIHLKKKVKSNQKNKKKKNDIKDLIYEANKYEIWNYLKQHFMVIIFNNKTKIGEAVKIIKQSIKNYFRIK